MLQVFAMGVGPTGSDEYRLDGGLVSQIVGKSGFHGFRIFQERQRIYLATVRDKLLDLGKGMRVLNVNALHDGLRAG